MTAAVVLAAGGSSRLGRSKQLIEVDGVPLVRRTAQAALDGGCRPVVVVVGAEAALVGAAVAGPSVDLVEHRNWRTGIAGSIRAGFDRIAAGAADGALVLVCDQIRLDAAVVRRLLAAVAANPGSPVASRYSGIVGVPAYFPRSAFPDLAGLRGDRGAREVLRRRADLVTIDWPDGSFDLDRPGDPGGATGEPSI